MQYKVIEQSQAKEIAKLATCLTSEIIERTGVKHFQLDISQAISLCQQYLANGLYTVIAAVESDKIVGFGALCQSQSLYAQGTFGVVQEFYVLPEYRSKQVGKNLLREIVTFAKNKQWQRLELCTPPVPEFERTVEFYRANGFEITGGYKMKFTLS